MYFVFFVRLFLEGGLSRLAIIWWQGKRASQPLALVVAYWLYQWEASHYGKEPQTHTHTTTMRVFKYTAAERPPFSFFFFFCDCSGHVTASLAIQSQLDSCTNMKHDFLEVSFVSVTLNSIVQSYLATLQAGQNSTTRGNTWRRRAEILQHTFIVSTLKKRRRWYRPVQTVVTQVSDAPANLHLIWKERKMKAMQNKIIQCRVNKLHPGTHTNSNAFCMVKLFSLLIAAAANEICRDTQRCVDKEH